MVIVVMISDTRYKRFPNVSKMAEVYDKVLLSMANCPKKPCEGPKIKLGVQGLSSLRAVPTWLRRLNDRQGAIDVII
jgi:hypothetical protein